MGATRVQLGLGVQARRLVWSTLKPVVGYANTANPFVVGAGGGGVCYHGWGCPQPAAGDYNTTGIQATGMGPLPTPRRQPRGPLCPACAYEAYQRQPTHDAAALDRRNAKAGCDEWTAGVWVLPEPLERTWSSTMTRQRRAPTSHHVWGPAHTHSSPRPAVRRTRTRGGMGGCDGL